MTVLHANESRYRQTGELFPCDHKSVKARISPKEAFLSGDPDSTTAGNSVPVDVHIPDGLREHNVLSTG